MEGEVMEGFICPICYKDLKTALNLNSHFQEHSQDDQKLLKSVKDFYAKAKNKIRGSEQLPVLVEGEPAQTSSRRIPGYPASCAEDPSFVAWSSHTDRFKAIRDMRNERYAAQTNTLLIRLEKLLLQLPTDPVRRKAFEQEIVPWLDDKEVSLCPSCAKPFNLLKRKHHCRLCGSVMCKNCTYLLSIDGARKMIGTSPESMSPSSSRNELVPSLLARMPTVQAVQAVLSLDAIRDNDFRICEHCQCLLRARETTRQNRNERPIIAQFYERLRTALKACDNSVKEYHLVYSSLRDGETKYNLSDAQSLRVELLRMADMIDSTSKKIAVLGQNTDSPPQGACLKLQLSIRNAAALYLKKNVVSLPSLPTEEEVAQYQERRRLEIERRIEEERRKEVEEERRLEIREFRQLNISANPGIQATMRAAIGKDFEYVNDDGWTPSVKQAIISDDPLLQQIGILHGFIEQAQLAGKDDECEVLRRNLMELEDALDDREAAAKT